MPGSVRRCGDAERLTHLQVVDRDARIRGLQGGDGEVVCGGYFVEGVAALDLERGCLLK